MALEQFKTEIEKGYSFTPPFIMLGAAVYDGKTVPHLQVKLPLQTINRHGLIAGATGTGKTKSLQHFAEALSENGVSVLMMDIKGDVSGMAMPGTEDARIKERHEMIGHSWTPTQYPVELMTISNENGIRLRATVSEFGPVLFSKILELNDNQAGVIALVFKYADDKGLPILDIKDFRKVLQHLTGDGKPEIAGTYGAISPSSANVILRKLIELEGQGADLFFGERSFEVADLLRKDKSGKGFINILRLTDIQDKPKLFSTFMLCLLAEIYQMFPEVGDKAAPKLVVVIDEAHLIFNEASKALLDQLETIIKLIRSKGVGIYFCTQQPTDIPENILSQLGLKIQHALRAFTAKDRKAIKLVAENYPETTHYKVDELLTSLGIGEALVTGLNEKGIPTPLVHTLMCAPQSRMGVLSPEEQNKIVSQSDLVEKYNQVIDRESAYEMLSGKINPVVAKEKEETTTVQSTTRRSGKTEKSTLEQVMSSSVTRTIVREVARGLMGVLFGSGRRR